ncbi:MAG: anhydro-N-acetylmuramic acid kinase [Bacteroidota bacterium]|nr:anhydro-N-acetylmuramic acid kinase [Bacteroidota bacterium]
MNSNVEHLYHIAQKSSKTIIGLMSGTSLDGLDIALCHIKGNGINTSIQIPYFTTVHYTNKFKEEVKAIFSNRNADLQKVCILNEWIAEEHAKIILATLANWDISPKHIDLIASHGQTIYHAPKRLHQLKEFNNATLQIGDGDHLAVKTGIITISDFRQKHVAAGGEGAPLAGYGDYFLFGKKNENRIMLNIGGIANFTFLPGNIQTNEVFCTDTGPGNTLMDAYIQQNFPEQYFDNQATIALKGTVQQALLTALKKHPFFKSNFPKTIGPELFNLSYLQQAIAVSGHDYYSHEDIMATLNRFTAETIVEAILKVIPPKTTYTIFTSGGGMHNPLLMHHLHTLLANCNFNNIKDLNINPDAKEAVLFAILANECISGKGMALGKGQPATTMGKISFPT